MIASGGVFATAIFMNTFAESDTIQIDAPNETEDLARFTDTSAPLAMMGSSAMAQFEATDSTPAKLELIYQGLESFDRWLAPPMDQVIHRELAREALRMQEIAIKESNNGAYDTSDPLSNFDFGSCLASLPGDRCVLLRMAGEGIALFAKCINGPGAVPPKNLHPDETPFSDRYCNEKPLTEGPPDALYGMTHGYLRMRAGLLALGQFEIESQTKTEAPLHAL
ncbi:hypothetical protein, partial [Okeania sp. SIO2G5]|uniref:hypothetical protein n=1 Tax=Okeania sp. SIO2G5 TaxID=2607796 RepID=UPI0013C10E0A